MLCSEKGKLTDEGFFFRRKKAALVQSGGLQVACFTYRADISLYRIPFALSKQAESS